MTTTTISSMMGHCRHLVAILLLPLLFALPLRATDGVDEALMGRLGWTVALACWTAKPMTVVESIDYAKELGFHHIEMYTGQILARDMPVKIGPSMDAAALTRLKDHLNGAGVRVASFFTTTIPADEAETKILLNWVKSIGASTLLVEPKPKEVDFFARVVSVQSDDGVRIAVHNHRKPSTYWDPQATCQQLKAYPSWVGLCCDTGHFRRSGLSPVDALRQSAGRIVSTHLKDLGADLKDVPFGKGINQVGEQLAELQRQGFRGVIAVEYESWGPHQRDDLRQCVAFLNQQAAALVR